MTFLSPSHLWLIVPVVALAVAYVVLQRRRRHYAVRFTSLDLLDSVAPKRPGWRRHLAAAAVGIGLTAMVVGLARPVRDESVPRDEAVVMLMVDTSASMEATDVSPSRLDAARSAAADFVANMPEGYQVGLVGFDGTARLLATPTTDHQSVIDAIDQLSAGPGTATGDALAVAVNAVTQELASTAANTGLGVGTSAGGTGTDGTAEAPAATIVLLSDGATTVGRSLDDATAAAVEANIPVSTIAYGTDSGTVQVEGQTVPVPADEASMAALADATGGTAFTAASAEELHAVYDDITARVGHETEQREIDRWFVGLAVVALFAAATASLVWSARML